jgi:uncharacterized protein involved in outer membrane biogenesis
VIRRILIAALVLILLAGALLFALPLLIDTAALKPIVQAQLETITGKPVAFRGVKLNLFPFALRLDQLKVGDLLETPDLEVRVDLWPLLQKQVRVQSIRAALPRIDLIQDPATGKWNYEPKTKSEPLVLDELRLDQALISVTPKGQPRTAYPRADLRFRDIGPGRTLKAQLASLIPVQAKQAQLEAEAAISPSQTITGTAKLVNFNPPVNLQFDLAQQPDQRLEVKQVNLQVGRAAARVTGAVVNEQLDLNIQVARTAITELAQLAAQFGTAFAPGLNVQGDVEANIKATGPSAQPILAGSLRATSLRISGGDLKHPVSTPDVTIDFTPDAIRSRPFSISSGPTTLNGYFSVRDYAALAPKLEAAVFAPKSQLEDLLEIAHAYGAAREVKGSGAADLQLRIHGNPKRTAFMQYAGKLQLANANLTLPALGGKPLAVRRADAEFAGSRIKFKLDLDSLDTATLTGGAPSQANAASQAGPASPMEAQGDITIGKLILQGVELAQVATRVSFQNNVLRLDPLTANLYGGRHAGAVTVDLRSTPPRITLESKLESIESGRLAAAATPIAKLIQGPLNAGASLQFNATPGADLARSLNGRMRIDLAKGDIGFMNLLGDLGKVARFLTPIGAGGGTTPFANLTGDLEFTNGEAATQNLAITLPQGKVAAIGKFHLETQALDLRIVTTLSKEISEQAGGTRIGGYLTAAIPNANGELVIPALLGGSFAKPQISIDAGEIARLKLKSTLPALKDNPGAIVEAIQGKKEGVRGLIDIFSGRKKKTEEKKPPEKQPEEKQ